MDFALRPLTADDIPALQRVYDECPADFSRLLGRPAARDQAGNDFRQAQTMPGRFQFGIAVDDELIGLADRMARTSGHCKLDDEREGVAHLGLLLLASPYNDPAIASLALRILASWLASSFGVRRLETNALAHDPDAIQFWTAEGFDFTGEQYRRDLPGYAPRFLVMAKDLPPEG